MQDKREAGKRLAGGIEGVGTSFGLLALRAVPSEGTHGHALHQSEQLRAVRCARMRSTLACSRLRERGCGYPDVLPHGACVWMCPQHMAALDCMHKLRV